MSEIKEQIQKKYNDACAQLGQTEYQISQLKAASVQLKKEIEELNKQHAVIMQTEAETAEAEVAMQQQEESND